MGRLSRLCMLFCFITTSSCTFIYDLVVMRKWDGGRYRYFIGLSDFHDKKHRANRAQLDDLQATLSRCSPDSIKIGSEDIGSPAVNHSAKCGPYLLMSQGGVLHGVANICRSNNFDYNNFEYRYCRVATLGPVLNNIGSDLTRFRSANSVRVSALIKEIETIFNELRGYNDPTLLRDLYAHCIKRMRQLMTELKLFQNANLTVANYLQNMTTPNNRLAFVKKLLTFDSVLLDLRILHNVIHSQKPNYLAIAGGSHTTRIAKLLSKLGYEQVHGVRPTFEREYNANKCLGSHIIDGKYCQRPKPVDVRVIGDFL